MPVVQVLAHRSFIQVSRIRSVPSQVMIEFVVDKEDVPEGIQKEGLEVLGPIRVAVALSEAEAGWPTVS